MAQKLTIKSVTEKKSQDGTKTFWAITDTTGADLSTFDPAVAALKEGDVIEGEVTLNGKHTNLGKFKVISQAASPATSATGEKPLVRENPEQRLSIEGQTSAKIISDLWIADKLHETSPEVLLLRGYLQGKLTVMGIKPIVKAVAQPDAKEPITQTQAEEDANALFKENQGTQGEVEKAKTITYKRDPATVKSITMLMRACQDDFGIKTTDCIKEVSKIIGKELKTWSEVTELPSEVYKLIVASKAP